MKLKDVVVLGFFLLLFSACNSNRKEIPDVSDVPVEFTFERLDEELWKKNSIEEVKDFLNKYPLFSDQFLGRQQYPNDSILAVSLLSLIQDEQIAEVRKEVGERFGSGAELKAEFEEAFRRIKHYYPNWEPPKVYTFVSGFGEGMDLLTTPDQIVVGLDYFLGDGSTFRPLNLPQYILKRYQPNFILPSVMVFLSSEFNKVDKTENTMLSDMIFYGKSQYFAQRMLPHTADSLLMGYTSKNMIDVETNKETIWAHFVDNQLFYNTSQLEKSKYLDERPFTVQIGNKCPGRIGIWLGTQIVESYMDKNEDDFLSLMEQTSSQLIFQKSSYRPQK